jgi:hypothetical protein
VTACRSAADSPAVRNRAVAAALAFFLGISAACRGKDQIEFRPTSTIKDIMDSMVDPSADVIWESVATIITITGTEEKAPQTDEEWKAVRRGAIRIIEATNLLLIPGRHVARPGEKAENENIELGPEEIEARLNQDKASWITLAHGLHDAGTEALRAIDARDPPALSTAGEGLDRACENCHLKYWYPPGKAPAKISVR